MGVGVDRRPTCVETKFLSTQTRFVNKKSLRKKRDRYGVSDFQNPPFERKREHARAFERARDEENSVFYVMGLNIVSIRRRTKSRTATRIENCRRV